MEVIDSKGRLFGVVNVIDALVVLVLFAVVVAGIALVLGGSDSVDGDGTTHVTIDLGTQSEAIAAALNEGDSYSPSPSNNLTVTDVYLSPKEDGVHALVRVELEGPTTEEGTVSTLYDGAPPRLGRSLYFETEQYNVSGRIRAAGGGPTLESGNTSTVLRAHVPEAVAHQLNPGTRVTVAGRTVAQIRDLAVYEDTSPQTHFVVFQADLRTYPSGQRQYFGDSALGLGNTLALPLQEATVSAQVQRLDPAFGRDTREVLVTDTIPADDVRALNVGDTYRVAGREVGRVESVTVYGTGNPTRKRVYVGLSLQALTVGDEPRFGTTRLDEGASLPFRTDEYELAGEVVRLDATEQRGAERVRSVTLQMQNLPPRRANSIQAGQVEQARGETIARLVEVDRQPSQVVLTNEDGDIFLRDHPLNQDLTITAELQVRETQSGVTFKGQSIQPGSTVTLDLDGLTVRAEVVSL